MRWRPPRTSCSSRSRGAGRPAPVAPVWLHQVRSMAGKRDHYEVLGVARNCSSGEIKAAYRRLALKWHPDRNPGDRNAEERFKELSLAYAVLGDEEKRASYDRFGEAAAEL